MRRLTFFVAGTLVCLPSLPHAARPNRAARAAEAETLAPDAAGGSSSKPTSGTGGKEAPKYVRIDVEVTAVQGTEIYLDSGQEAGIAVGDRVLLTPSMGSSLSARIVSVTRTTARARLDTGQVPLPDALEIGADGVVLIPAHDSKENSKESAPEHPPWKHDPIEWQEDIPLLAPIQGRKPEERDRIFRGRAYTSFDYTRDNASVDSTYSALRAGIDSELENPFGRGGNLQLDLAYTLRSTDVEDDGSETESLERIERLSYRFGGVRGEPRRYEVGRFLHSEFPELGLIDGIETVHRFENGARIGGSVGYLPEYDDHLGTGDDFALSVFGNWVNSEAERLALGAALQKTWHKGKPDRDLLIGTADWSATDTISLRTSAWIDFFTSDDDLEDSSASLTQLQATGTWRIKPRSGLSLTLSQLDWPQLLRNEFEPVTDEGIRDYKVTRVAARAWTPLSDITRLSVRVDQWSDEETSGAGGEVSVSTRDLLWEDGRFTAAVRAREGRTNKLTGLRLLASRNLKRGTLSLRYDAALFDQASGLDNVLQHTATTSWDWSFSKGWDLSLYVEARFGDDQDSQAAGVYLQRRF